MKVFASIIFCLLVSTGTASAEQGLPADVAAFITSRDLCDHLRGEVPNQPTAKGIRSINDACKGTDRRLASLKSRYRDDKDVMQRLSAYEDRVEAGTD